MDAANSFTDNTTKNRYEHQVGDAIVFADYRKQNGTVYLDHVEAPQALRGTGAAGRLMEQIMTAAQAEKLRVVPVCGYAAAWMARHARPKTED